MTSDELANPFFGGDSGVRSLNRARIVALPGVQVADDILGQNGYQLLSSETLRREIVAVADALHLDPAAPDLIRSFDGCFDDPPTRPAALRIAGSYGRRLGYLLLMLHHGDAENRAGRPEWSGAHWKFWADVEHIYVGGGMLAGRLGQHAVAVAREVLAAYGAALDLQLSLYGVHLPLVGLARSAPAGLGHMLLLDFGQTSVKHGEATYIDDAVARLDVWQNAPTVCSDLFETEYTVAQVRERWAQMRAIIQESWSRIPAADQATTGVGMSLSLLSPGWASLAA
ncbi:MAG: hypothetical protein WCF84_08160 [Anaerolineae bacterium]